MCDYKYASTFSPQKLKLQTVANPVRKKILKMISEGKGEEDIMSELGINRKELDYHLRVLEWGFCIERDENGWKITKEGEIIDHL